MHKDNNIGKKFVCFTAKERLEKSKELSRQGYEYEVKYIPRLFEDVWIIKIIGYIKKEGGAE